MNQHMLCSFTQCPAIKYQSHIWYSLFFNWLLFTSHFNFS